MTTHEASPCVRHHHYSVPTSNSDTIALSAVFGVNREQDVSVFDLALIAFRLVLWNTHADECSRKSSGRRAASRACQGRHDRTGGDKGSKPWNCQRSDTHHPAQRSAQDCTSAGASGGALRSLGVLLVGEILGASLVRKEHRDVVLGEANSFQIIGYRDGLSFTLCDTKYCFVCDVVSSY